MARVSDQYITEPSTAYSGSVSDLVFYGDMFLTASVIDASGGPSVVAQEGMAFLRQPIISKAGGILSAFEQKNILYSDRLRFYSGSYAGSRTKNAFKTAFSAQEFYYDSFVPSPISVGQRNGVDFPYLNSGDLPASTNFNLPAINDNAINVMVAQSVGTIDSDKQKYIDTNWLNSPWPFQSRYKNIIKNLQGSYVFPDPVFLETSFENNATTDPVSSSTLLGSYYILSDRTYDDGGGDQPIYYRLCDIEIEGETVVDGRMYNGAAFVTKGNVIVNLAVVGGSVVRSTLNDFHKTFYGFGPGFNVNLVAIGGGVYHEMKNLSPDFEDAGTSGGGGIEVYNLYGPKIFGFRYGLLNTTPQSFSFVYRRDSYGQLRDMLEQRKDSKKVLNQGASGLTTSPPVVGVSFVSGTNAGINAALYLNATSSLDFNPRDSGQWDYEYKSGQPFFDGG